jgi:hypothetical protein
VRNLSELFWTFLLNYSQLRSIWLGVPFTCMLPNTESAELAIMIKYVADIILILTMLLGFLRIRGRGGDVLDLACLLQKQVRGDGSSGSSWYS